jgi:hypothetical protein
VQDISELKHYHYHHYGSLFLDEQFELMDQSEGYYQKNFVMHNHMVLNVTIDTIVHHYQDFHFDY